MTDPLDIIAANTRNGHTAWQNVARQLGRSVDSVRAQFDPTYLRAYIWAPSREAQPEMEAPPVDENDTSSPYGRGPGLKAEIACLLSHHARLNVEDIANQLGCSTASARKQLSALKADGLAVCSERHPSGSAKTWSAVTRHGLRAKERV